MVNAPETLAFPSIRRTQFCASRFIPSNILRLRHNRWVSEVIDGITIEHHDVLTNGVRLHCAIAGPTDGPLVIALHGFPEFWRGMLNPMLALAKAGYRVVTPDQRGYNFSEKPGHISDYRIEVLAADVAGLITHFGSTKAHILGHDWGAAVAWWLALTKPDVIRSLAIVNVPHPRVLAKQIRTDRRQLRKSWYMFALQIPWLPERLIFSRLTRPAFARVIARTARPDSMTPQYQQELRNAWTTADSGRGMAHWYRAAMQQRPPSLTDKHVHVPTLILWGRKDFALTQAMAEASAALCDDVELVTYDDATHWLLHDEPVDSARRIIEFFNRTAQS